MNLQDLFNLAARKGKASTIFVPQQQQPSYFEIAARQPQRASTVFIPQQQQQPSFLETATAATEVSPLFKFPKGRPAPGASVPITTGLNRDGEVDRTQSDMYRQYAPKPFPMTQAGQFERYFQTPEMDAYFGAASRGAAAPKTVAAMQQLAGQTVAPGTTPEELSAFYRAQSAMGRAQMPEIQGSLGFIKGSPMAQWAEANPMLAQRLYAKQQSRLGAQPGSEAVADLGSRAQAESGYAGTFREQPGLFQAVGNPVVPTEDRAGTGMTQGERVDLGRGVENLRPRQMAKTNPMNAVSFNQ